ncbi:MAG: hypothetical protein M2R45_03283 [Verrucomicrobia subdivision 3 bacterium]|nr:hypothetical protein [Limisphaerales bacterium]MCS1416143.1 hypothetical protein [Limisphaerales bacterium]
MTRKASPFAGQRRASQELGRLLEPEVKTEQTQAFQSNAFFLIS